MATVQVTRIENSSSKAGSNCLPSVPVNKSTLTTTGSAQTISFNAGVLDGNHETLWAISVTGANIWVQCGLTPTAASGSDWLVMDGAPPLVLRAMTNNETVSIYG